jgi:hypothetical protein
VLRINGLSIVEYCRPSGIQGADDAPTDGQGKATQVEKDLQPPSFQATVSFICVELQRGCCGYYRENCELKSSQVEACHWLMFGYDECRLAGQNCLKNLAQASILQMAVRCHPKNESSPCLTGIGWISDRYQNGFNKSD